MPPVRPRILVLAALLASACQSRSNEASSATSTRSEGASSAAAASTASAANANAPEQAPAAPQAPAAIPAPPDVAAPPADARRTPSGLASKVITPGTGTEHPTASSVVRVHYTGWTTDGQMFDSSVTRGEPTQFPLNGVIPGWTEGVQLMVVGEKRRFWIPVELAYNNRPGAPAGMLVFDVELLGIIAPPTTPSDVAAPPRNAECAENRLCSRVLTPGRGGERPGETSVVTVELDGWTTDGQMFDSSAMRGEPARFPLDRVTLPGLAQGIRLMTVGEKRRLWIPQELAFANNPRAPQGMLVFDVTLVSIDAAAAMPPVGAQP